MSRVRLEKGRQKEFLSSVAKHLDLEWPKIAKISNVCERTLRDWRGEKYNMSYDALLRLHKISNVAIPKTAHILPEYWSTRKAGRLGAIKRNELYGNLGTAEGRRRGGLTALRKFRENPKLAKKVGFKLRAPIESPKYSPELAEFFGIMLGDGYIKTNKTQAGISFNMEIDYEHAVYIKKLIKKLFGLESSILRGGNDRGATVLVSNMNLVEFLISKGLKAGDKVINQVGIPNWIKLRKEYRIACLRGLIDTDGSFYSYTHCVNGKIYKNYALDFTNRSEPLLQSVKDIFQDLGCSPTLAKYKVVLHKKDDIRQYIADVGTSNLRIREKFRKVKFSNLYSG